MTEEDDLNLEHHFGEARRLQPMPSEALMKRILADAEATSLERTSKARRAAAPRTARLHLSGRLASLIQSLGGWPAVGSLAASTVLGVGLGAAQPAGLSELTASFWGETVSVTLGVDDDPLSLLEG